MQDFGRFIVREILTRAHTYVDNNWDYLRHGANPVQDQPQSIVFDVDQATTFFIDLLVNASEYNWLCDILEDDRSRQLLIDLLTFRVLGYAHVKLPANTDYFWEQYRSIDARFLRQPKVAKSWLFDLNLYGFDFGAGEVRIVGHPLSILMLILRQYYYDRDGIRIGPEPGDVIVDGGGCWGEAAIAFAHSVGDTGKVYSFEFVPSNLALLRDNLARSAPKSDVICVVERALSSQSQLQMSFDDMGPGTAVRDGAKDGSVETITIDDFVQQANLEKVDFIKLDIEGCELAALQGAQNTIRRFKPKLAISVYHRINDYFTIPQLIRRLGGDYRFYMEHYSIHREETILYAQAR